jgi:hypothetical protein
MLWKGVTTLTKGMAAEVACAIAERIDVMIWDCLQEMLSSISQLV